MITGKFQWEDQGDSAKIKITGRYKRSERSKYSAVVRNDGLI